MSRVVEYKGRLWPRSLFEDPDPPPGSCVRCGGVGLIPEQIDEERFDVLVPCHNCQRFCAECRQWVERNGHRCIQEAR